MQRQEWVGDGVVGLGLISRVDEHYLLCQHRLILCSAFRGVADAEYIIQGGALDWSVAAGIGIGALLPTNQSQRPCLHRTHPKLDYELGKHPLASDLCDTVWWRVIQHL